MDVLKLTLLPSEYGNLANEVVERLTAISPKARLVVLLTASASVTLDEEDSDSASQVQLFGIYVEAYETTLFGAFEKDLAQGLEVSLTKAQRIGQRKCKQFVISGVFDADANRHRKVLVRLEEASWACRGILQARPMMVEAIFRSKDKDYMQTLYGSRAWDRLLENSAAYEDSVNNPFITIHYVDHCLRMASFLDLFICDMEGEDACNDTNLASIYGEIGWSSKQVVASIILLLHAKDVFLQFLPDREAETMSLHSAYDVDTADLALDNILPVFRLLRETLASHYDLLIHLVDTKEAAVVEIWNRNIINAWQTSLREAQMRLLIDESGETEALYQLQKKWQKLGLPEQLADVDFRGATNETAVELLCELCVVADASGRGKVIPKDVLFMVRDQASLLGLPSTSKGECYTVVYMATAGSVVCEGRPQCSKFERVISGAFHNRQTMSCAGLEIHSVLTELVMGNPRVVELLFLSAGVAVKRSPAWEELVSMRRMFLTERCITGYLAFIQSELAIVKKNIYLFRQMNEGNCSSTNSAFVANPALLQQELASSLAEIFQKLFDLRRIISFEEPHVCVRGEEKMLITSLCEGPLEGNLDLVNLELKAWKFVSSLRALKRQQDDERELEGLGGRPAEVNVEKLAHWMLSMRVRRLRIEFENVEMDTAVAGREISLEEELIQMGKEEGEVPLCTSPHMGGWVTKYLRALERDCGVKVVHAAEIGDRASAIADPSTPLQVVAVFVHHHEQYFSMAPSEVQMTDTFASNYSHPAIVIRSYELRHAIRLMEPFGDVRLLEAFASSVVYSKCADATQRLRKCLRESLPDNLSLVIAWASQAQMLFSTEQDQMRRSAPALLRVLRVVLQINFFGAMEVMRLSSSLSLAEQTLAGVQQNGISAALCVGDIPHHLYQLHQEAAEAGLPSLNLRVLVANSKLPVQKKELVLMMLEKKGAEGAEGAVKVEELHAMVKEWMDSTETIRTTLIHLRSHHSLLKEALWKTSWQINNGTKEAVRARQIVKDWDAAVVAIIEKEGKFVRVA